MKTREIDLPSGEKMNKTEIVALDLIFLDRKEDLSDDPTTWEF